VAELTTADVIRGVLREHFEVPEGVHHPFAAELAERVVRALDGESTAAARIAELDLALSHSRRRNEHEAVRADHYKRRAHVTDDALVELLLAHPSECSCAAHETARAVAFTTDTHGRQLDREAQG
jgi:hypothetical protein